MSRPVPSLELPEQKTQFRRQLLAGFGKPVAIFPGGKLAILMRSWFPEVMLQQTQVASVLPLYTRWLERFPNFEALASSPRKLTFSMPGRVSVTTRAPPPGGGGNVWPRTFTAACREISPRSRGSPASGVTLPVRLPALPSICPGTHRRRQYRPRAYSPDELATTNRSRFRVEPIFGRSRPCFSPRKTARAHNSALMDLGAMICLPRNPRCRECPVCFILSR